MIKMGRIVDTIGPAGNGLFGAQLVKVALSDPPVEVSAYAKQLDPIPFYVEIFCALLGKEMSLPVPEPIIAFSEDGNDVLFASMKIDFPDLSQRIAVSNNQVMNTPGNTAVFKQIAQWADIEMGAAFDEWIANEDRNLGNILFDGVASIKLIDHNLAMRPHFSPNSPIPSNTLLNIKLAFNDDEVSKQRIKNQLTHLINELDDKLPKKIRDMIVKELDIKDTTNLDHMLNFLVTRLNVLAQITANKVPVKQQSL